MAIELSKIKEKLDELGLKYVENPEHVSLAVLTGKDVGKLAGVIYMVSPAKSGTNVHVAAVGACKTDTGLKMLTKDMQAVSNEPFAMATDRLVIQRRGTPATWVVDKPGILLSGVCLLDDIQTMMELMLSYIVYAYSSAMQDSSEAAAVDDSSESI